MRDQRPMREAAIEALVQGRNGDPFALLGPHREGEGWVIRALLPGVRAVTALAPSGQTPPKPTKPAENPAKWPASESPTPSVHDHTGARRDVFRGEEAGAVAAGSHKGQPTPRLDDGAVTLPYEERERSTPYGTLSRRDGFVRVAADRRLLVVAVGLPRSLSESRTREIAWRSTPRPKRPLGREGAPRPIARPPNLPTARLPRSLALWRH